MSTFSLHYQNDGRGLDKRIEFDGPTPAMAFWLAGAEPRGRRATLFADGEALCELGCSDAGYWVVGKAGDLSA